MRFLRIQNLLKRKLFIPILICSREQVIHLFLKYSTKVNQDKFTSSVAISSLLGMIQAKISSVFKLESPFLSNSESNLEENDFLEIKNFTNLSFSEISHSLSLPWPRSPTYSWKLNSPSPSVSFSFKTWPENVRCWICQKDYLSQDMGPHSRVLLRVGKGEELFHI